MNTGNMGLHRVHGQRLGQKRKGSIPTTLLIGLLAAFLVGGAILVISGSAANCKDNVQCFIGHAVSCEPAILTQVQNGATFKITSQEHCALQKEIVDFHSEEPKEVADYLQGRSMECSYTKGDLHVPFVTDVYSGIEECSGDLKNALYELVITSYEIER